MKHKEKMQKADIVLSAERDIYGQDYQVADFYKYNFSGIPTNRKRVTSSLVEQTVTESHQEEWDYYSVNGNNMYFFGSGSSSGSSNGSSFFVGGKTTNDLGEKSYNSPVEYLNSSDNKSEYSYKNAYVIPTSQKQDDIVKQTFITESNKNYNLATQNCATAVEKSLSEANLNADFRIDKSINVPIINNQIRVSITTFPIPSILYDYIKTNNPGYEINQ